MSYFAQGRINFCLFLDALIQPIWLMPNGKFSNRCCPARNRAADIAFIRCEKLSTPSDIYCEPVVRGGYCRTIFRTGERFTNTSKSGSKTARGSKSTIICTNNCARKCRARNNHRQLLLIHNRWRRPKKGGAKRLRWRQENSRSETAHRRWYDGTVNSSCGSFGGNSRCWRGGVDFWSGQRNQSQVKENLGGYGLSRRMLAAMDCRKHRVGVGDSAKTTAMGLVSWECRTTADACLYSIEKKMGRGKNICLVGAVSQALERLRIFAKKQRDDDLSGDEWLDAEAFGNKRAIWNAKQTKTKVKALRANFLNSL